MTRPQDSSGIADKVQFARRWGFAKRSVDTWLAMGMPHVKLGERRVRIVVSEADKWLIERFGRVARPLHESKPAPTEKAQSPASASK